MPITISKSGQTPRNRNGKQTKECAEYVNGTLFRNGITSYGDAPNINGQFKEIFNGYSNSGFDRDDVDLGTTHNDSIQGIRKIHNAASDAVFKNFDSKTLNKDHIYVTNMYYKTSPHMVDFYNKGTDTPGTHTGILYWNPQLNSWRVNHNIYGVIYDDDFINLQSGGKQYGVTAISDANEKTFLERLKFWKKQGGKLKLIDRNR